MSLPYQLFYLFGFAPWDQTVIPDAVRGLTEGAARLPPGRALDVGCGRGNQSIHLARAGWDVTGVDAVGRALRTARRRARAAGVTARFVPGDALDLAAAPIEPPFDLVLDCGCFHGLAPAERARYPDSVAAVARPGATLLMFAFLPQALGRRGPRGAAPEEIAARLAADWETAAPSLRDDAIAARSGRTGTGYWYRLRRR